tara:strand:+ start:104 stop:385 length:282 start_codon:yes stop_codon:yes gene_type:complete
MINDKEKLVNGWWCNSPQYLYHKKPKIKNDGDNDIIIKQPRTMVRVCIECSKTWQRLYVGRKDGKKVISYEYLLDFPTYGLTRQICPKCKNDK